MRATLLIAILLLGTTSAYGRDKTDPYEDFRAELDKQEFTYDETLGPQWKEKNVNAPPVAMDKLRKLNIDHGPRDATILIDPTTLNIDKGDRVTRYWVVIEKNGRPGSVNYEGLRCATREYKSLAYASPRKPEKIKPLGKPQWRPINHAGSNDFHRELAEDYLCSGTRARDRRAIMAALGGTYELHNPYSEYTDN